MWMRVFSGRAFRSTLVDTATPGVFEERFGALRFLFFLRPTPPGVEWRLLGWSLFAMPLPRRLAPCIRANATGNGKVYRFSVLVSHRWLGILFGYRGTLGAGLREQEKAR